MKKIYIAEGTIERHDNIYTDILIVKGRLIVTGIIRAKRVYGDGFIEAGRIVANSIVAGILDVDHICAKKVIADKVFCLTAIVSIGIIAKDYIEGHNIRTARLIAPISEIERTEAKEIIHITPKRSFIGSIFCSWLHERFASWRYNRIAASAPDSGSASKPKEASDIEFDLIINSYRKKYSQGGYRIVLEPVEEKTKKAEAV